MPIVHVHVWEGFSEEKKKQVIEGITKMFVDMDIPKQAVHIVIHETPKVNWGIDGKPATESRKDIKPPT
ncbi:MAG: 4-oxalocrotonate tautomerase [Asgard group archaeon]|nr:4-oxalocrotonate tautomerase [Asgard group archaeon]